MSIEISGAEKAYKTAQDRIAKAAAENSTMLDLRIDGLATLPPEIANLTTLKLLDLIDTKVNDIAPIANLTALKRLNLNGSQVSDITPIANLKTLNTLDLSGTQVCDITPLAELTELKILYLIGTQVDNITPIANLTALEILQISDTGIHDLRLILNFPSLQKNNFLNGIYFKRSKACEHDPNLARLADISENQERAQKTFDYLRTLPQWPAPLPWEKPDEGNAAPKPILSVEAVINAQDNGGWVFSPHQHLLAFHISETPLSERQNKLAELAAQRQRDLVQKIGQNNSMGIRKEVLDEARRFGDILADHSRTLSERSLELWGSLIALGGLLEGNEIARLEGRDPLDLLTVEMCSALQTLVAISASLVRSFPEAEALDNDLSTFNRTSISSALILALLEKALNSKLIDKNSAALMQHVEAQSQGTGAQAQKAAKVSIKGTKNLILSAVMYGGIGGLGVAGGAVINDIFTDISDHYELGEQSIELIETIRTYFTEAEPEIEEFLERLHPYERASIKSAIEDLKTGPDRL